MVTKIQLNDTLYYISSGLFYKVELKNIKVTKTTKKDGTVKSKNLYEFAVIENGLYKTTLTMVKIENLEQALLFTTLEEAKTWLINEHFKKIEQIKLISF